MHASKGQNQRLVQALHSAERSIHVSFRNKGVFECSKSKTGKKITDVRAQLAGKSYWVWGFIIHSKITRTSTSHNRPWIIPASFGSSEVGHVHAVPVTSSRSDVTMLLTHPGDTSHQCCCRLLERQLANLRWHLFSLTCRVAFLFSFLNFFICCSWFGNGTCEPIWQQQRPLPLPDQTSSDMEQVWELWPFSGGTLSIWQSSVFSQERLFPLLPFIMIPTPWNSLLLYSPTKAVHLMVLLYSLKSGRARLACFSPGKEGFGFKLLRCCLFDTTK